MGKIIDVGSVRTLTQNVAPMDYLGEDGNLYLGVEPRRVLIGEEADLETLEGMYEYPAGSEAFTAEGKRWIRDRDGAWKAVKKSR